MTKANDFVLSPAITTSFFRCSYSKNLIFDAISEIHFPFDDRFSSNLFTLDTKLFIVLS